MAFSFKKEFSINWGDCSPSGAVFYPNYFRWFDQAVWELFEAAGQPILEIERRYGTVGLPLVGMETTFHRPCRLQDRVTIESSVIEWQTKRLRIQHEIAKESGPVVTCIETRFWGIRHPEHPDRLKSVDIPKEVIASFA